jgi:transposase
MVRPKEKLELLPPEKERLEKITRTRESPHSLVQRATIILKVASGVDNKTIAQELELCEETVGKWRKRWVQARQERQKVAQKEKQWYAVAEELFKDRPRAGSPGKITAEQVCQIIALACETPPEHLSHWTRKALKRETIKRGIVSEISESSIGRFLKSGRPQTASE